MGAATNFGKSDLGINSPTHRNTHAEEDLFQSADDNNIMNNNIIRNDLLEDMFKTCTTPSPTSGINNHYRLHQNIDNNHQSDTEFNPREDESQEFGDFESAFGNASGIPAAAAPSTIKSSIILSETKNNDFDFAAAFGNNSAMPSLVSPTTNLSNSNNLLFSSSVSSVPMFGQAIPSTNLLANSQQQPGADLLSDFGGLNLASPMVDGELKNCFIFFFILLAF